MLLSNQDITFKDGMYTKIRELNEARSYPNSNPNTSSILPTMVIFIV